MNSIYLVEETVKLPSWAQNLVGFLLVGLLIFVVFVLLPILERSERKKFILRNAGTLLSVMDKRADILFFVKLYDMSVSEILAVWFNLTYLIADHNGNFNSDSDTIYSDDSKNPYTVYRCVADQFSDVRFFKYFEQKKIHKFFKKYNFGGCDNE